MRPLQPDDKKIIPAMQQKLLLTRLFADPDNLCVWLSGGDGDLLVPERRAVARN